MKEAHTNALYLNRSTSNGLNGLPPDRYLSNPSPNFVLCRNAEGEPTAIYGEDVWDFNPYRLSAKRLTFISFKDDLNCDDQEFISLIYEQIKWILFTIIYQPRSGKTGRTSAATLGQYFFTLRKIGRFCVEQLNKTLAAGITVNDVLMNTAYMNAFLSRNSVTSCDKKVSSAILEVLAKAGFKKLGFTPCSKKSLNIERAQDKQHPVIPSRIYIEMMLFFDDYIEKLHPFRESLKNLIVAMDDRDYGASIATQNSRHPRLQFLRPTMIEAMAEHGLINFVTKSRTVDFTRASLVVWLKEIQYVCKMSIHLYTGMRDQEAGRLLYDCTTEYAVNEPILDSNDKVIDPARMIDLISTTTKFSGYKKEESWIAPECALKAIELAQAIAEGVSKLYKIELNETTLFVNPAIIRSVKSKPVYSYSVNTGEKGVFSKLAKSTDSKFRITEDDLVELNQTDPARDFGCESCFSVGNLWPIVSHQFRRSLAFYASNSGFVSLDTVTSQFKHVARLMAKYYGRGNENLLPIFVNNVGNKYTQAKSHIAHEFQLASPINVIEQLFFDVFENNAQIFGGTGSYMEKMKTRIDNGEIAIFESKEKTIKMARDGHISYRKTALGGCTSVVVCKCYLMGEITDCLTSSCSIIEPAKVNSLIAHLKVQLKKYEPSSCEFELAQMELEKLESYKRRRMTQESSIHTLENVDDYINGG